MISRHRMISETAATGHANSSPLNRKRTNLSSSDASQPASIWAVSDIRDTQSIGKTSCHLYGDILSIKLIALDLDGTTLRHDLTVHPRVQDAFTQAKEQGVILTLATGRAYQSTFAIADRVGFEGSFVCINGAYAANNLREPIFQTFLDPIAVNGVFDFADLEDLHVSAYTTAGPIANRHSEWLEKYRKLVGKIPVPVQTSAELAKRDIHKLVIIAESHRIAGLRVNLTTNLGESPCQITESAPEYLEILPAGTNKGYGLAQLCVHLGIDRSEVAAIGDYKNDLEMLEWAGTSGAVKNALDEVKSLAQIVVNTNEEGGAGEFIEACLRLNCNGK